MKKAALFFLALVILVGYAVQDSEAGQSCWQVGTTDYIKVSATKPDPLYPHKLLNGIYYRPSAWILPVVGTMENSPDGSTKRIGLNATYVTGSDLYGYIFDLTIDSVTKNGTLLMYSDLIGNTVSYSVTKIDCATAPAP